MATVLENLEVLCVLLARLVFSFKFEQIPFLCVKIVAPREQKWIPGIDGEPIQYETAASMDYRSISINSNVPTTTDMYIVLPGMIMIVSPVGHEQLMNIFFCTLCMYNENARSMQN